MRRFDALLLQVESSKSLRAAMETVAMRQRTPEKRDAQQEQEFNDALNKIAPFLEGVEDAHLRATQIVLALLLQRDRELERIAEICYDIADKWKPREAKLAANECAVTILRMRTDKSPYGGLR